MSLRPVTLLLLLAPVWLVGPALLSAGPDAPPAVSSLSTGGNSIDRALEVLGGASAEEYEDFFLLVPGGEPAVRAIFALPRSGAPPYPAVLLNHGGFDGFSRAFLAAARKWREAGFAVAASEYRGEGGSAGEADFGGGEVEDVLRLLDWLRERPDVDPDRLAMVGYSRGGTVSLLAAARGAPVAAVVAYSPVTDLEGVLSRSPRGARILQRRDLTFDHTDPGQVRHRSPILQADRIEAPLLLLHGEDDPLVPVSQSTSMAAAVSREGGDARVLVYHGAAHHLKSHPGAFEEARAFVEERLPPATPAPSPVVKAAGIAGLPPLPDDPYQGVRTGGIFQRMSWQDMQKRPRANIDSPLQAGIDFNLAWSLLEPEPDRYDWSRVEEPLEVWGGAGKRIVVNIVTLIPRGTNPMAGHATPGWVFDKGAKKVTVVTKGKGRTGGMTSDYPLFWDPVYLREYEDMVRAFAERFDGHPDLDAVAIGVGKLGGLTVVDPKISPQEREEILSFYRRNGFSRERYFETIRTICLFYRKHFRKTPVRLNLSNFFDKKDSSAENLAYFSKVGDWAASEGVHLFYQGGTGTRDFIEKMRHKPIDEIFRRNAGKVLSGIEPVHPIRGSNPDFMGTVEGNVENALGLSKGLQPTLISWMNFYMKDCKAANPNHKDFDPEWYRAFQKALQNLRLVREE